MEDGLKPAVDSYSNLGNKQRGINRSIQQTEIKMIYMEDILKMLKVEYFCPLIQPQDMQVIVGQSKFRAMFYIIIE